MTRRSRNNSLNASSNTSHNRRRFRRIPTKLRRHRTSRTHRRSNKRVLVSRTFSRRPIRTYRRRTRHRRSSRGPKPARIRMRLRCIPNTSTNTISRMSPNGITSRIRAAASLQLIQPSRTQRRYPSKRNQARMRPNMTVLITRSTNASRRILIRTVISRLSIFRIIRTMKLRTLSSLRHTISTLYRLNLTPSHLTSLNTLRRMNNTSQRTRVNGR